MRAVYTNLIQGLSLHVKDVDVPIVRVSMNQMSLFVLIQMKHFRLTVILIVLQKMLFIYYFILYSENQCISKLDKIGIFIDMKFH